MQTRFALALALALAVAAVSAYDPNQPYQVPAAYQADLSFQIPYIGMTETAYVYTDSVKQKMRIDYYSGMDTYIFSNTGEDYSVIPVNGNPTCLQTNSSGNDLTNIFPDMTKFYKLAYQSVVTTAAFPNGIKCNLWYYSYGTLTPDAQGHATSRQPDSEGYMGNYTFYVSAVDGTPVRFEIHGHNVVLGGSHNDVYLLDYLSIIPMKTVADDIFNPPSGMPCHLSSNPFGPTFFFGDGGSSLPDGHVRSNPLEDVSMLFPHNEEMREAKFQQYENAHGKVYRNGKEREARKNIFHSNLRFINAGNRRGRSYHLAANHLADRTESERRALMGYMKTKDVMRNEVGGPYTACGLYTNSGAAQPQEVDWRVNCPPGSAPGCTGLVLPPKDQGTCGSCWTYGTTGSIEAAWAKKTGSLVSLSEQNIIDCTWNYGVAGCGGGSDYIAYAWLLDYNNGSIASDASYGGYTNQNGFCHYDLSAQNTKNPWTGQPVVAGATFQTCTHVTKQWNCSDDSCVPWTEAVNTLSDALAQGYVLSVAIDATTSDFYFYSSGYYYSDECKAGNNDLDHQVLAVGYTQGPDGRYTIIKNSWSDHWGEGGYVKISQQNNCCGVGTQATFTIA